MHQIRKNLPRDKPYETMPGDGNYIGGIDANGTALDVAVPSKARCGTLDELNITKEGAIS